MSERYTRKDAEKAFERLCDRLGKRIATSYGDVGAWSLDYSPYGGYVIEEIATKGGAVSQPFGFERMSAREFWFAVRMVNRAFELDQAGPVVCKNTLGTGIGSHGTLAPSERAKHQERIKDACPECGGVWVEHGGGRRSRKHADGCSVGR